MGDYEEALQYAYQSLAIQEKLRNKHPSDKGLLKQLALTHDAVGSILRSLGRVDEALDSHRKSLELFQNLLDQNPQDAEFASRVGIAHFRIGNDLREQGRTREALEQHFLPYAKPERERPVDPSLSSSEAHSSFISHVLVGSAHMELDEPAKALPHFEFALRWKQMQVQRDPNNARYARDWSEIHAQIGNAQIALGRFDVGLTNLQESVRLAESILERDPVNGSSRSLVLDCLHDQAQGLARIARAAETSPAQSARLWLQVIQALSRCQEKLAAKEMAQRRIENGKMASKIAQELDEARAALATLSADTATAPPKP